MSVIGIWFADRTDFETESSQTLGTLQLMT
jgi:hypothetical protein